MRNQRVDVFCFFTSPERTPHKGVTMKIPGRLFKVPPRFSAKVISMLMIGFILFALPAHLFSYPRTSDDLIETSCEEGGQDAKRILIAYDTIHGSTAEVADQIGKELCSRDFQVDVRFVGNIASVEEYDAIILGSAIYEFNWLPDARRFLRNHYSDLSSKPVAVFIVCSAMYQDTPESRDAVRKAFVTPLLTRYPAIIPLSIGLFGGAVDFNTNRYNLFEKIVLRILAKVLGFTESADWRDWDYISDWAEAVGDLVE
jgi:menaquinone-dependent protoporphyrinogen oxidase